MGRGKGSRERETPRANALERLKDRLSFGATLISVAAVAIFVGWLIGQYLIQTVTGPRLTTDRLERPPTVGGAGPAADQNVAGSGSSPSASSPVAGAVPVPPSAPSSAVSPTPPPSGTTATVGSSSTSTASSASGPATGFWRVQAGAFSERARADQVVADLHARGFEAVVTIGAEPVPYRVQVGAFREEARARALLEDLRAQGFEAAVFAP